MDLRPRPEQLRKAHWFYRLGLPLIALVYLTVLQLIGGLQAIHYILVGLGVVLCLWSDGSRRLARIGLPFLLYGAVYDSMRYYEDYIRSPIVHVREPYDFDLRFFSIGGATPNEWLQRHTSPILDFFCGLAYTPMFFIGESVLLSIYLMNHHEDKRAERFVWSFVAANFIGFACYYIYPAAPPWYVADHGFQVDLTVRASPAGAIRFDQLIGFPLMQVFYGQSADVFGAIPSLHVVYPFLAMVFGWQLPRFRRFAVGYWVLVCFSAIYLNHHYLLDLFVGIGIACFVVGAARVLFGPLDPVPLTAPDLGREPLRT